MVLRVCEAGSDALQDGASSDWLVAGWTLSVRQQLAKAEAISTMRQAVHNRPALEVEIDSSSDGSSGGDAVHVSGHDEDEDEVEGDGSGSSADGSCGSDEAPASPDLRSLPGSPSLSPSLSPSVQDESREQDGSRESSAAAACPVVRSLSDAFDWEACSPASQEDEEEEEEEGGSVPTASQFVAMTTGVRRRAGTLRQSLSMVGTGGVVGSASGDGTSTSLLPPRGILKRRGSASSGGSGNSDTDSWGPLLACAAPVGSVNVPQVD